MGFFFKTCYANTVLVALTNARSLEPAGALKKARARLTALGMTNMGCGTLFQFGLFRK